jgi:hypothetical protein
MIKNVLTHIGGVEVYGVISICLFFAVFSVAVVLALRMKKSVVTRMSALPLEDGQPAPQEVPHE